MTTQFTLSVLPWLDPAVSPDAIGTQDTNTPDRAPPAANLGADAGDAAAAAAIATNLFLGVAPVHEATGTPSTDAGSATAPPSGVDDVTSGWVADGGLAVSLFDDENSAPDSDEAGATGTAVARTVAATAAYAAPSVAGEFAAATAAAGNTLAVDVSNGGGVTYGDGSGGDAANATQGSGIGAGGATPAQVLSALDATGLAYTGAGITVGVLSDSFNDLGGASQDESDGALPPANDVDDLQDLSSGGTDEGRAMLQIVHDVASGADLDFYTGTANEQEFAAGILALANAGCKVICDDIAYFDEPFFQTGLVASAIQTVEQEGVTFLTAAGNSAATGYLSAWTPIASATFDGVTLTDAQNFAGPNDASPVQTIVNNTGGFVPLIIQWDQPYGAATTDLGVVVFQNGVDIGQLSNFPTADGFTQATEGNPSNAQLPLVAFSLGTGEYQVAFEVLSGPNLGLLEDLFFNNTDPSLVSLQDANIGTVFGHAGTPYAITVGAVASANTPGNGGTLQSEPFSSSGAGTEVIYNFNGTEYANAPIDLNPVAVSGVDDVATTLPNGLSDFFGTSAATPSVAGIVADMLQANPALTPMENEQILEETATAFGDPNVAGAGLVNGSAAISAALDTINWTAAGGGAWLVAGNWSDAALPSATQDIGISTSNAITVSQTSASVVTINTLLVDMNDTLDWVGGSLAVGSGVMVLGALDLDTSAGQGGATMTIGGTLDDVFSGAIDIGNASLASSTTVSAGGFANEGPVAIIGNTAGGDASLLIAGAGTDTGPVTVGPGAILSAGTEFLVSGAGVVTVSSGGAADNLIVANGGVAAVLAGGSASGGIGIDLTGGGTAVNAGTVVGTGGTAIYLGGAGDNRLLLDPGYAFSGAVVVSGAYNSLELGAGASPAVLSRGLGGFADIASVTVDNGAAWTLSGSNTVANGVILTNDGTLTNSGILVNAGTLITSAAQLIIDPATLINSGQVVGALTLGGGSYFNNAGAIVAIGNAVYGSGGVTTIANNGTISGSGAGVDLLGGGTVVDAGTIVGVGGTAVQFGGSGSNLLVLEGGYGLGGVVGGSSDGAINTVELAGASGDPVTANYNTLGLGNFQNVLFDGNAKFAVSNTSGTLPLTVSGFTAPSDVIDLTSIGTNGTISSFSTVSNTVTIAGSLGTVALSFGAGTNLAELTTVSDGGAGIDLQPSAARDDFTGSGASDVLWQNSDGELDLWTMSGGQHTADTILAYPGVTSGWDIASTGDFFGDGTADILWQNSDGAVDLWTMSSGQHTGDTILAYPGATSGWQVVGTGDFYANGTDGVLWQNSDGELDLWTMSNGQHTADTILAYPGGTSGWQIVGTGDFAGNGTDDILWQNTDGAVDLWTMSNGQHTGDTILAYPGGISGWQMVGTGDFTGNGTDDILWQNSDGTLDMWTMSNGQHTADTILAYSGVTTGWQIAGTGDFYGNGTDDILWHNTTGGAVDLWTMQNGQHTADTIIGNIPNTWQTE